VVLGSVLTNESGHEVTAIGEDAGTVGHLCWLDFATTAIARVAALDCGGDDVRPQRTGSGACLANNSWLSIPKRYRK